MIDTITNTLGSLSTVQVAGLIIGVLTVLVGFGWLAVWYRDDDSEDESVIDARDDVTVEGEMEESAVPDGGHVVSLEQPRVKNDSLPVKLYKLYKNNKSQKKIGEEGYVRWYLIDDTFSEPKFVKPERQGGGLPEYEHDGETYLFPREALVPDGESGMWTAVHKRGDAMPLNLGTPGRPAIPTDELKEYLTKRVTSSPPSWMSNLFGDFDTADLLKLIIIGFIGIVLAQSLLGGMF
jgi:hypothetical protein